MIVKVTKGTVDCGTALRVENQYAADPVRAGPGQRRRGAGRGERVDLPGLSDPEVLSTGNASQCHTGSAAIVAVLLPRPGARQTAG